jgi:hypothetical protein
VTNGGQKGYYPYSSSDPAIGSNGVGNYNGGVGGAPSWHCNFYGYDYGPNYNGGTYGYKYMLYYYWLGISPSYPDYYYTYPDQYGFRWENIPGVTPSGSYAPYPMHYFGYYSPSSYFSGVYAPPEGSNGQGRWIGAGTGNYPNGYYTNYGLCIDYAYTYYMSSGQGV